MRLAKQLLTPLFFVAAAALPAHEAAAQEMSLTGQWELTVETPNGTGSRQVTLVQTGDSISGTITSSRASGPLYGTVEDGKVTFVAELMMDSGPFTLVYEGEVAETEDGLTMFGTVDMGDYGQGTFRGRKVEGEPEAARRTHPLLR